MIDMNVNLPLIAISANKAMQVNTEGLGTTYAITSTGNTPAATPTDVFTLYGSATKKIKIKRIRVGGAATTAGTMTCQIVKRTAANTGGTSTAPAIGKFDSTDGDAVAVPALYSANPSALGAGVALRYSRLNCGIAGSNGMVEFDFGKDNEKPIILNSATEGIAINFNGNAVPAGGTFGFEVIWEEI